MSVVLSLANVWRVCAASSWLWTSLGYENKHYTYKNLPL